MAMESAMVGMDGTKQVDRKGKYLLVELLGSIIIQANHIIFRRETRQAQVPPHRQPRVPLHRQPRVPLLHLLPKAQLHLLSHQMLHLLTKAPNPSRVTTIQTGNSVIRDRIVTGLAKRKGSASQTFAKRHPMARR